MVKSALKIVLVVSLLWAAGWAWAVQVEVPGAARAGPPGGEVVLGGGTATALEGDGGRVVRFFDFDERRLGNREDLPIFWQKVEGVGLPHYVNGRIVQGVGRSSNYSFRFDLNGGSLIYRFDPPPPTAETAGLPGPIAVKTGARYRIEAFVKTTALENARARLTAYFVDRDMRVLEKSVMHSEAYRGKGLSDQWKALGADLRASDKKAAFLILELGLLQPAQYAPSSLGARTLFNQDVTGSAWFTDLTVSQVPEVALRSDVPGNIFPLGTPVTLGLRITDREASDLTLRLDVYSADGTLVHQRTGELQTVTSANGLEHDQMIPIPELPAGWYEARIRLTAKGREVANEVQSFIQLPDAGKVVQADPRFGVIATSLSPSQWATLPTLLPTLGVGRVKISVWGENSDIQTQDAEAFDRLLERLQDAGIVPTAALTALPPDLAAVAGSSSLARLPRLDEALWKPRLSYLIARHANHLDRWQLGYDGQEDFVTDPAYRRAYDLIYSAFAGLVHDPDVAIPWPATFEADRKLPSTVAIALPPDVLPDQVPLYVQDTRDRGGQRLSLTLLPLDGRYGREAQLRDFAQRIVTALSAGTERLDLPLPFSNTGQPQELLLIMRTVHHTLSGTVYRGKLNVGENVDAYLFEHNGRGVIALWTKAQMSGPTEVRLNLGGRPALVDLFGNATALRPTPDATEPGQIKVELGQLPVFVDGIDPAMALFRVSVALDNPLLESQFQPHMRKIVFTNRFADFLSGTVRLVVPKGWTVTPNTFTFNTNPGETFTREIQLELPYNTLAGAKNLEINFELPGLAPAAFMVPVEMRLGLNEVGLQTLALREGKDIVVQLLITNYGQRTINYTAFALFPGQARQERLVTDLGAGRTTVRRFRFPAPEVPPDPKRKIRVGLREVEGTRILNDEVVIPQ